MITIDDIMLQQSLINRMDQRYKNYVLKEKRDLEEIEKEMNKKRIDEINEQRIRAQNIAQGDEIMYILLYAVIFAMLIYVIYNTHTYA